MKQKKLVVVVICSAVVLIVAGLSLWLMRDRLSNTNESPEFDTVLPADTSIATLGGWSRVSPPGNDPVYAYSDTVDDTPITLSQQPLPVSFRDDSENKISDLAKNYGATSTIDVEDITVYIGTSSNGPQSVIFAKNDLLILIKSNGHIENSSWQRYIASLE